MTGVATEAMHQEFATSADGGQIGYRTGGSGPSLIVVGGSLRTSDDYLPLSSNLVDSFTVHLVERRGRGASAAQGEHYSLQQEVDDLLAVQSQTQARLAFGHSYGGLVILEALRRNPVFDAVVTYEPGVTDRALPTEWMAPYRARLAASDPYGAFAHFIKGSGGAPAFLARMPHWYLRFALTVGLRGENWRRMELLLESNLIEHEQLAAQFGRLPGLATIQTPVFILEGGRTTGPGPEAFDALHDTVPHSTIETLSRLNHFGPEGSSAPVVAERIRARLLAR
jgi:pimeloyl-ACP methyl ester carboxylesterase